MERNPQGAGIPQGRRQAVAHALSVIAPRLPEFEQEEITDRALSSPGLRNALPENAAWLALVAYARHVCTDYETLLEEGYDRDSARHFIVDDLNTALTEWGVRRRISGEEDESHDEGDN